MDLFKAKFGLMTSTEVLANLCFFVNSVEELILKDNNAKDDNQS